MCGPNANFSHFPHISLGNWHHLCIRRLWHLRFHPYFARSRSTPNLRNFYRTYGANKCPKRRNVAFLLYRILRILSTTPAESANIRIRATHVYTPPYFQEPASCGRTKTAGQTCTNVRSRRYVTFSDLTSAPDAAHAPKASAFFFSSECAAMSGTSPEHAHSFVL